MGVNHWVLTDTATHAYIGEIRIGPDDVGGSPDAFSVQMRRLQGGLSDGIDAVEIDNGEIRFTVLPTRGMGLWRVEHVAPNRADRPPLTLGWQSPVRGPVHPKFVPLMEPGGLGWLSGFDELLVRCGLSSNGPPIFDEVGRLTEPLHGRIANTPAHRVELTVDGQRGEIALIGVVDEARLFHSKLRMTTTIRTRIGESELHVTDEVTNLSSEAADLQLLYHINFGKPLLEPGAKVVLPARTIVPSTQRAAEGIGHWDVYGDEEPGFAEQVYFFELLADDARQTQTLLRNAAGDRGVSLRFNVERLPRFIVWKSTQPEADGYVTGLEPAINFPNAKEYEQAHGRVAVLEPGETRSFDLSMCVHAATDAVGAAEAAIDAIRSQTQPEIHRTPQPGWSPAGDA